MAHNDKQVVTVTYTNHRGETRRRTLLPIRIYWGQTQHHPTPQWLMEVLDQEKGETRSFALSGFAGDWQPATPPATAFGNSGTPACPHGEWYEKPAYRVCQRCGLVQNKVIPGADSGEAPTADYPG